MEELYIFLDIDGVFNSGEHHETLAQSWDPHHDDSVKWFDTGDGYYGDYIVKHMIQSFKSAVNTLSKEYCVKIYIVSSWVSYRTDYIHIREFFGMPEIVGQTDYTGGGFGRGDCVLEFVQNNMIKNWIVVDDSAQQMYHYPILEINSRVGFTQEDKTRLTSKQYFGVPYGKY